MELSKDEIIRMAREAGLEQVVAIDPKSGIQTVKCPPLEPLERFAALVASRERSIISETFWAAVNDCITTDELGVEFMSKFYQVHEFGHWLDGKNK